MALRSKSTFNRINSGYSFSRYNSIKQKANTPLLKNTRPTTRYSPQKSVYNKTIRENVPSLRLLAAHHFFQQQSRSIVSYTMSTRTSKPLFFEHKEDPSAAPLPQKACWSCSYFEDNNTLFCKQCDKIQPTRTDVSYFELMNIPQKFNIDINTLEKNFQQLQRRVHPDRFQRKTSTEQSISARNSSIINEAYKTLKEPNERALYLLKLRGYNIEEIQRVDDLELLNDVLEKQEIIQDEPANSDTLKEMNAENEKQLEEAYRIIGEALDSEDMDTATKEIVKIQYLLSIQRQLKEKLPSAL